MTVKEAVEKINGKWFVKADETKEIKSAYCGDFLSYAISSQDENCIWFTVMNNANVAGVASLTDCALIVICDKISPDDDLLARAKERSINICVSEKDVYTTAILFSK